MVFSKTSFNHFTQPFNYRDYSIRSFALLLYVVYFLNASSSYSLPFVLCVYCMCAWGVGTELEREEPAGV